MCGIAGVFGKCEDTKLEAARSELDHRGPDDSGIFFDPKYNVGLIHTRLSILDLSLAGHQPMFSDDGDVVLVFNGEIYNYRELKEELRVRSEELGVRSEQVS